ncbi:testis-expressed protein 43-like [Gigantopelta aegis]|uniref:testis-expressed protein 43-like n=1 Tax=Gigantopelta aegis TaxID=1735272 RepID=UPI001B888C3D|nr:testis-expressed protein 43-like [Gigantopelta aegis]
MPLGTNINQHFKKNLFTYSEARVPVYSRMHPMIPKGYTMEWKTDMKNRELIIKNAKAGGVPHYEHDERLFLEKREQMYYNVESRNRVESKYPPPIDRCKLLRPDFEHQTSKYQSELMQRTCQPFK